MKRSPFDLDLTLLICFVGFNLNSYNSSDQRLRLNHFYNNLPAKYILVAVDYVSK